MNSTHLLPLILPLVPLAGIVAVPWMSRRALPRLGLIVTLLSAAMTLPLILFSPRTGTPVGRGAIPAWERLLSRPVGIDGTSLVFLSATVALFAAVCLRTPDGDRPRLRFALVLWVWFAATGVFVSSDLLQIDLFLLAAAVGAVCLSGRRRIGARIAAYLGAGLLCLATATLGLRLTAMRAGAIDMKLATLASPSVQAALAENGSVRFPLTLVGMLLWLGIFPLHAWFLVVLDEGPPAAASLIGGLFPMIAGYGLRRIAVPLFPYDLERLGPALAVFGAIAVGWGAFSALAARGFRRTMSRVTPATAGFVLTAVAVRTPTALEGAILLLACQAVILPLFPIGSDEFPPLVRGAALVGWTILIGFLAPTVILIGMFQTGPRDSGSRVVATIEAIELTVLAAALATAVRRFLSEPEQEPEPTPAQPTPYSDALC